MEFTPTKSPKEENEILTYVQLEQNNSEENNNNNEQNNPFNNSPLKYYCSDITEIDKQNENGWTPIYRAIIANNLNALKELLKFGANPNLQNNIGETPLYLCVDIDNYDAIVTAVPSSDTVIEVENGEVKNIPDRAKLMRVQTPQCFKLSLIKKAHELSKDDNNFTDDCGLVLKSKLAKVHIIKGDINNIKITYPQDIKFAELLKSN